MSIENPKQSQDAGAPETDVTPDMVEAGLSVLHASGAVEHPIEADRLVIEEIYRAMRAASCRA